MRSYRDQYEHNNSDRLPFFWLGEDASKIIWYCDHYEGLARRCHLAMSMANIVPLTEIIHPRGE